MKSTSRLGDINEYVAISYYLELGFEVFHNVSSVGPADIVLMDTNGNLLAVDVKAAIHNPKTDHISLYQPKEHQAEMGIEYVHVLAGKVLNAKYPKQNIKDARELVQHQRIRVQNRKQAG